jgi:hypothetical protein
VEGGLAISFSGRGGISFSNRNVDPWFTQTNDWPPQMSTQYSICPPFGQLLAAHAKQKKPTPK